MIQEADAGRVLLLPPTAYNPALLARAGAAESFVLERPEVTLIMLAPKVKADGGARDDHGPGFLGPLREPPGDIDVVVKSPTSG
jgi:hypothetical protein